MITLEGALIKFDTIFNQLSHTAYLAYLDKDFNYSYPKYCLILFNKILSFNHSPKTKRKNILSKEDIEQQLRLIWFIAINNYYKNKPTISL